MKAQIRRLLNEPENHLVLFFIRKNTVFPVVISDCSLSAIKQESERLERQMNGIYSGRLKTVGDWNTLVNDGKDPCAIVYESLFNDSPLEVVAVAKE